MVNWSQSWNNNNIVAVNRVFVLWGMIYSIYYKSAFTFLLASGIHTEDRHGSLSNAPEVS